MDMETIVSSSSLGAGLRMAHANSSIATLAEDLKKCGFEESAGVSVYTLLIMNILTIIVACKTLHALLGRLGQPRIISDFIVGGLLGNLPFFITGVDAPLVYMFRQLEKMTTSWYMFVVGLEMEPYSILKFRGPESSIANAGIITTSTICIVVHVLVQRYTGLEVFTAKTSPRTMALFAIFLSSTSYPIVTRLTTQMKIGKSEIGRLAIRCSLHIDMVCNLICSFIFISRTAKYRASGVVFIIPFLIIELLFVSKVYSRFINWLNHRNPEGKPIRGTDMAAVFIVTNIICFSSYLVRYDVKMNSFLVGLALSRHGRISNFLISKMNYALTAFVLPLYLTSAGLRTNLSMWSSDEELIDYHESSRRSWIRLSTIGVIAAVGKGTGTLIAGLYHGLNWLEAITLGVLLNIKGYFHIFLIFQAKRNQMLTDGGVLIMLFTVILSIVFVPMMITLIVNYVRDLKALQPRSSMGLQWHYPKSELRMMVGLHSPLHVPGAVNLIETLRAGAKAGLAVYAVDMVELTDKAEATLVYGHGNNAVTVADEAIMEMRDQIGSALNMYVQSSGRTAFRLQRILAISSFSDVHEDICAAAEDSLAVLIIMPFHKTLTQFGGLDEGHLGFRLVNLKVLQHAPCSVGFFVDRGLARASNMSGACVMQNVAMVFIGGPDDREALAYAGYIAQHPSVRLTVIRFITDVHQPLSSKLAGEVDDDCFADFYNRHIAKGAVQYTEKHVASGLEVVEVLRAVGPEYHMFILGRGMDRDSVLTSSMIEWPEFPELGPIGDILASTEFPWTASVLVIQRHGNGTDL